MDQALATIHQACRRGDRLTFLLATHHDTVGLFVQSPDRLATFVTAQLRAAYPDALVDPMGRHSALIPDGWRVWHQEMWLAPDLFPLKRYRQFEDSVEHMFADPLSAVLGVLSSFQGSTQQAAIEIEVGCAGWFRPARARAAVHHLNRPFFRGHPRLAHLYARMASSTWRTLWVFAWLLARLAPSAHGSYDVLALSSTRAHDREDDLQAASDKLGQHLFAARVRLRVAAPANREKQTRQQLNELVGAMGHLGSPRHASFRATKIRMTKRISATWRIPTYLLSTEELATLFHPPTQAAQDATIARVESRELAPPPAIHHVVDRSGGACVGVVESHGRATSVRLLLEDRLRHVLVLGKTGMGKSTLIESLVAEDMSAGHGVACLDPHGDLIDSLLARVPRRRTNDVILFDAAGMNTPAFNPLECPHPSDRPLVSSAVLSAFKRVFATSWGPRLEHFLRHGLLAAMETPGATLATVLALFSDDALRKRLTDRLRDPVSRAFWQEEFARLPPRFRAEAVAPVQNKLGPFLAHPALRRIFCSSKSGIRLRPAMDDGQILLMNLSKGRLGDDAAMLLGSLLVSSFQLAAMGRADITRDARRPFLLHVDEFHSFATESFAAAFSELRKYGLGLVVATQFLEQLDIVTQAALFGNAGTIIAFQLGQRDAQTLAEQLNGQVTPADLMQLPKYRVYMRMLLDGVPTRPFSLATLPPSPATRKMQTPEQIRRATARRYASTTVAQTQQSSLLHL
ncbi:MAG: ATP-binding protein [Pirellulales bacterium]|nr:ATP-binding protein [Pirellulales bacterium]